MPVDPRVALVCDQGRFTGIGTYTVGLCSLLRKQGCKPILVDLQYLPSDFHSEGVRPDGCAVARSIFEVPLTRVRNERSFLRWIKQVDIPVHLCGTSYALADKLEAPLATVYDYYVRRPQFSADVGPRQALTEAYAVYEHIVAPKYLSRCRALVSISQETRGDLLKGTGLDSTVIPVPIDATRFAPRPKEMARARLSLPMNARLILAVSSRSMNKNPKALGPIVDALSPEYLLVKIGSPATPASGRVINVGNASDELYPLYFDAADVFVHTATKEGFGIPLIEAMASGLPVVAARTQSAEEVLGLAGRLIPAPYAPTDFVSAIRRLELPGERQAAITSGLSQSRTFSEDQIGPTYRELYSRVLGV